MRRAEQESLIRTLNALLDNINLLDKRVTLLTEIVQKLDIRLSYLEGEK